MTQAIKKEDYKVAEEIDLSGLIGENIVVNIFSDDDHDQYFYKNKLQIAYRNCLYIHFLARFCLLRQDNRACWPDK